MVDEGDVHVGTELASGDGFAEEVAEGLAEGLVEGFGVCGGSGTEEGGSVAFFGGGVEGELGDDGGLAVDVEEGGVHFAVAVFEDAEAGDFSGKPVDVAGCVGLFDTEENEEAKFLIGDEVIVDGDGGLGDPLDDGSHELEGTDECGEADAGLFAGFDEGFADAGGGEVEDGAGEVFGEGEGTVPLVAALGVAVADGEAVGGAGDFCGHGGENDEVAVDAGPVAVAEDVATNGEDGGEAFFE